MTTDRVDQSAEKREINGNAKCKKEFCLGTWKITMISTSYGDREGIRLKHQLAANGHQLLYLPRNNGNSDRLYFLGLQITADGDCSHEVKRCFLLGTKAMTNLDSMLKSRDITLPTKVCIVKGMVFPVVRCESWTIKRLSFIDAFELWCWKRLLRVPWTARRSNQSILKEISPECSLEGLMLK